MLNNGSNKRTQQITFWNSTDDILKGAEGWIYFYSLFYGIQVIKY